VSAHAGLPAPADIWLQDQLTAWQHQASTWAAGLRPVADIPEGQAVANMFVQYDAMSELLATARQLIAEVLR
jgi:hypothetical protein